MVVVGGAGGLDDEHLGRIRPTFSTALAAVVARSPLTLVDGGTDAGMMRLAGETWDMLSPRGALIGVAVERMISTGRETVAPPDAAPLEPHHTHFMLVPGDMWEADSPWIAAVATALAGDAPSVTVIANGGPISYTDVEHSVKDQRPVITLAGSGRVADDLAAAVAGGSASATARRLVDSGLIQSVDTADPDALGLALQHTLDVTAS